MGLLDLNNDVISRGCAGALLAAMFGIFVAVTVVPSPSNIMAADQKDALAAIVPGDVAWMLASSALVLIMTPGVAFFYGGMGKHKNVVATIMQAFMPLALVAILWTIVGFSLSFGDDAGYPGFIGNPATYGLWKNVGAAPNPNLAATIPLTVYAAFQLMFAIITPALIIGSVADRVNFSALCIFITLWHLVVYCPIAHMVWHPAGILRMWGVLDFAGGTVVHMSSGYAALAAAWFLGRSRPGHEGLLEIKEPANVPYVVLGASLLWFGWFGFNAGSAGAASYLAGQAFYTTNTATATAMMSWLLLDHIRGLKFRATGVCVGAVVGLVAITPAAGFVDVGAAALIGIIGACVCTGAQVLMEHYGSRYVDDTLDVFACHGVGGTVGCICTSLFASSAVNSGGNDGAFYGNGLLLGKTLLSLVIIIPFFILFTLGCLYVTNFICELRVSEEDELMGLDVSKHGERAIAVDHTFVNSSVHNGSAHGGLFGVQAPAKAAVVDKAEAA